MGFVKNATILIHYVKQEMPHFVSITPVNHVNQIQIALISQIQSCVLTGNVCSAYRMTIAHKIKIHFVFMENVLLVRIIQIVFI